MEETKTCPYCGEEILAVAKKCKHCGEWLPVEKTKIPCPICGEGIDEDTVVCPHCNEKVKEEAPTPTTPVNNPTPKPDGEKKNWKMIGGIAGCAVLVIAIIAWALSSGSGESGNSNTNSEELGYDTEVVELVGSDEMPIDADLSETIKSRITSIYADALNNRSGCEKKYFTTELYSLYIKEAQSSQGEIGAIDYDIWSQSQDPYQPKATIESINVSGNTFATVHVAITDGSTSKVVLTMKYERGNWFVDELQDAGGSLRARLNGSNTSNASTSSSNWQFGNYKDEFGDTTNKHVIGAGVKTEYGSLVGIYISKDEMTFDCSDCASVHMGSESRLSIKKSDGSTVRIPIIVKDKNLVVFSSSSIQDLVQIFEQGNFKICIQDAIDISEGADHTYNITVRGELRGVRDAMSQWIK